MEYERRIEEENLHEFAQHNEHCERLWNVTEVMHERGEFQRDRERIVNSRAFRRMVDKAQIFTSSKGDHYRTRMTHTMEVAQIARSISNSLKLNIDLTEAIALGHDLGHTPFGHQGERTLQDILNGKIEVGLPKIKEKNVYGGFKHNFQSVRVLNCLEEKYIDHEGLDVSCQVLEGVLKHTDYRQKECSGCELAECNRSCCDMNVFLGSGDMEKLYLGYICPTTLEAQVVAVADEVAQRSHDMDDAMSARLLDYDDLKRILDEDQMRPLRDIIDKSYQKLEAGAREYISKDQMVCARVISDIINYLVNDVVAASRERMREFEEDELYCNKHRFSRRLIFFSHEGERICQRLESIVQRKVINSPEIAKFDYNADKVIRSLFRVYYQNPKLLHVRTLREIEIELRRREGYSVNLVEEDPDIRQREFCKMAEKEAVDYWERHVIFVRRIVDYIAGMTDSYARNEYCTFYPER